VIRVIIGRRTREGENIVPMLRELRAAARMRRGYVSGETLVSGRDNSLVIVTSIWQSEADWKVWEKSEHRAVLYQRMEPFLVEKPWVKTYHMMSNEAERVVLPVTGGGSL